MCVARCESIIYAATSIVTTSVAVSISVALSLFCYAMPIIDALVRAQSGVCG